ncbi:effector-associated domain EAD1-containing protein [Parafrankia sp. FMc2]|uniref:effector-associated domain EAD1-containing protein n=1 Tax=Parafrankia sp. FMc2 TaxID=3233196 RepID=UPI0034D686A3
MRTGRGRTDRTDTRALGEEEVVALSVAYYEPATVRILLERVGIPLRRQPSWVGSPQLYWHEVNRLLGAGLLVDGRRRLLRAAAADYPANRVFAGAARPRLWISAQFVAETLRWAAGCMLSQDLEV